MEYKQQLEQELLIVLNDLKSIKYMKLKDKDAINAKRMAYEYRMEAILKALELVSKQEVTSKRKKGGVKIV